MISVGHGKAKEIAKVFGVSTGMVSMSLKGKRNGALALKIRYVALTQYDGVELTPVEKDINFRSN